MCGRYLPILWSQSFAGEMLDVDAYTGGFNLQIAFSTGRAAAAGAVESLSGLTKNK